VRKKSSRAYRALALNYSPLWKARSLQGTGFLLFEHDVLGENLKESAEGPRPPQRTGYSD